jgi:hypothetical protein
MRSNLSHMIEAWRACRRARFHAEAQAIFPRIVKAVRLYGPVIVGHSVWSFADRDLQGEPIPGGALHTSIDRALREYGRPVADDVTSGPGEGPPAAFEIDETVIPTEAELARLWGLPAASSITFEVIPGVGPDVK